MSPVRHPADRPAEPHELMAHLFKAAVRWIESDARPADAASPATRAAAREAARDGYERANRPAAR